MKSTEEKSTPETKINLNDLISDELIMLILNAIGYEERSWIPVVRKHLLDIELTLTQK